MKILLIGGTGFVSGYILANAAKAGHDVTVVTRGARPMSTNLAAAHIVADREREDFVSAIDATAFDAVIDCICMKAEHALQSVELARQSGNRLIMISTDYVYDPAYRSINLTEDQARFSDRDDVGGNKRRAEKIILDAHDSGKVRATILRPPHIYGPGSNPGTIPRHGRSVSLLQDIAEGKTLHLLHGGLGLIQPIHVDDFARIVVAMLNRVESFGQAFNASGPEVMTHLDYYRTIASLLGQTLNVKPYCPDGEAPDVNHYVGGHRCYDMGRLNAVLPGFAYTRFADGMAEWVKAIQGRA